MKKQYRITYDLEQEDSFNVHTDNGIVKFSSNDNGLYLYNLPKEYIDNIKEMNNTNYGKVQLITTVAENRSNYSMQQFEHAKEAHRLYHNLGAPTM